MGNLSTLELIVAIICSVAGSAMVYIACEDEETTRKFLATGLVVLAGCLLL